MKRLILSLSALAAVIIASAQVKAPRAEWRFNAKNTAHYIEKGHYHAAVGQGEIEFVGKKATAVATGRKAANPAADNAQKGDYWLATMPAEGLKAGSVVDIWFPFLVEPSDTPQDFALEYLDGKQWKPVFAANKKGVNCHSTTSDKWPRFAWQSVRLDNQPADGKVQVRLRQCSKGPLKVSLYGTTHDAPKILALDERIPSDTTRVLFIGNSYTYHNLYPLILKEMAWYEGHYLDCNIYIHGGYTMKQHLANHVSRETVERGGYDYAFLQDQSLHALRIGTSADMDVVGYMGKMKEQVEKHSPKVKCFIELTWGRRDGNNATKGKKLASLVEGYPQFFTSYKAMQDVLTANTTAMAQKLGMGLSPVGHAWEIIRRERPDIDLYSRDGSHPSYAGSYLSAAVAYLTLFGEPFKADMPARLNPETARYLRNVAERVVLRGEGRK